MAYKDKEAPYEWGLEARGGVFTFGQNSYGELGHGDVTDRTVPTRVELLGVDDDVVDVACGNEQTALLCGDTQVYACGYNDSGQCGTGSNERVLRPTRVLALADKKIVRIFSGNGSEHLAALSETGALFTFGFNSRGQLGHGTTTTSVSVPTLVQALTGKRIVEVACSYFHTVILSAEGEVFACGRNDFGQLGTGDGMDRHVPTRVAGLWDNPVKSVSCGQHHTVVAASGGGVYAFGKNDHGQLGLGSSSSPVLVPTRAAAPLDSISVTGLACGYYHTVIVADDGAVYSFGRNDYGQLGHGHKQHIAIPTVVEALSRIRIIQVACGCYHSLTLSEEGKVYPFGRNNHGQLGLETSLDCLTPQIIPSLRANFVKKLAAGFYHSVCLVGASDATMKDSTHGTSLSADLRRMLNNPVRSDVTFLVEGTSLHAHSCILMTRCEPLEKMLDGRTKDGSLPQIVVPDCSYDAFASMLEFLYTDEVTAIQNPNCDPEFLLELMALADQYLVTKLKTMCESAIFRVIGVCNVCLFLQAAHFSDAYKLKRRCVAFILDHFGEVIATEAFVSLSPTLLQEVLLVASRNGVTIPNQAKNVQLRDN